MRDLKLSNLNVCTYL